jgi:Cyclin, N-terminal domain/Cyclin, C-terminal domain
MDHPECFEQIQATLDAMRYQESTTYMNGRRPSSSSSSSSTFASGYLDNDGGIHKDVHSPNSPRHVNNTKTISLWRLRLTEWMSNLVVKCNLERSSVALALYFLDSAINGELCQQRQDFQLAAATCLQLALKCRDTAVIQRDKLVALGNGAFTAADLSHMEFRILKLLNWHLHAPTVYCFLRQYERLLPAPLPPSSSSSDADATATTIINKIVHELSDFVADLTLLDEQFVRYPPSVVAYAIQLFVMDLIPSSSGSAASASPPTAFLPIHSRQSFVVRMNTVGRLSTINRPLLAVFELIKETVCLKAQRLDDIVLFINNLCKKNTTAGFDVHIGMTIDNGSTRSDNNPKTSASTVLPKSSAESSPTSVSTKQSVSPCSVVNTNDTRCWYDKDSSMKSFPGTKNSNVVESQTLSSTGAGTAFDDCARPLRFESPQQRPTMDTYGRFHSIERQTL